MSSLERLLSILDVFTEERPIWTLDEMIGRLGFSRSMAYRYVKELAGSGLLMPIGKGRFVLGPRIIELDRQIRVCDPLLTAARAIMRGCIHEIGEGVLTLSSLYGERMMCVHQEPETSSLTVSYTRGRTLPLFIGSTSRAIIAHLPERKLLKLFLQHRPEISAAGLGEEWGEFKERLREIRQAGLCLSHAAIDPGVLCAAVPLFNGTSNVLGAMCLIQHDYNQGLSPSTEALLREAARRISAEIGKLLSMDAWAPLRQQPSPSIIRRADALVHA